MPSPPPHPLAELIVEASEGRFPPVDGEAQRVPPWRPGLGAVFAFTGHAVLAVDDDVPDETLAAADGFGGAHDPRLIAALAGPGGWIDTLDAVLAGRGTAAPTRPPPLLPRPDLADHPRAVYAAAIRHRTTVLGYPSTDRRAVAIIARTGLAGLPELSFELEPDRRGRGAGRALVRDALATVPAGELILASVAPGNTASLRTLLDTGFVPVGSVQLFRPVTPPRK